MICEDNVGGISGHSRWGVHLTSDDGIKDWRPTDPIVFYIRHDILDFCERELVTLGGRGVEKKMAIIVLVKARLDHRKTANSQCTYPKKWVGVRDISQVH